MATIISLISSCSNNKASVLSSTPDSSNSESRSITIPTDFPIEQLDAFTDIYDDRFRLGQGLKTGTYEVVQTAIDTTHNVLSVINSQGGTTSVKYEYATDYFSLRKALGLTMSINANIGWFSASASIADLTSTVENNLSTFLIAKVSVRNVKQRLTNPVIKQEHVKILLEDPKKFYDNFGDRFIAGYETGGELFVIYEFKANSYQEKSSTEINVKASYGSLSNSVEAVVNYSKSLDLTTSNKKVSMKLIRLGDKSDLPKDNLDEMLDFIRSFPAKVTPHSGNEAFLKFITEKYTNTLNNQLITAKQVQLDIHARQQRKMFQLLSWKQEKTIEAIKSIRLALDKTRFDISEKDSTSLTAGLIENRNLQQAISNCYEKCSSIDYCQECEMLLNKQIYVPDLGAFKPVFRWVFVEEKSILNNEMNIATLNANTKYKLQFKGMLYAQGFVCFETFISPENDSRAVPVNFSPPSGGGLISLLPAPAYPIIVISTFSNGVRRDIPLTVRDKIMELTSEGDETIVRAVNRYYLPRVGRVSDQTIPFIPCSGNGMPSVKIYKLE